MVSFFGRGSVLIPSVSMTSERSEAKRSEAKTDHTPREGNRVPKRRASSGASRLTTHSTDCLTVFVDNGGNVLVTEKLHPVGT
jgi:hypothetical protein